MAESKNNLIMFGLSGSIGDQVVFRNVKGRIIVSSRPKRRSTHSEAQMKHFIRFREAVFYAKAAIANDEIRKGYAEKAGHSDKVLTAYNVAVGDFLNAPEVREIDLSGYGGCMGDVIRVCAIDDFQVKRVWIRIEQGDGMVVESGAAMQSGNGADWVYRVQNNSGLTPGHKVVVHASDLPGNVTVGEKRV